jgi:Transcription factor WhiB
MAAEQVVESATCVNCGGWVERTDADRLKDGRCPACYAWRQRHDGQDRPSPFDLLAALLHQPASMADGACNEHPHLDWFDGDDLDATRAVCDGCLVRDDCAAYATAHPDIVGVWAGRYVDGEIGRPGGTAARHPAARCGRVSTSAPAGPGWPTRPWSQRGHKRLTTGPYQASRRPRPERRIPSLTWTDSYEASPADTGVRGFDSPQLHRVRAAFTLVDGAAASRRSPKRARKGARLHEHVRVSALRSRPCAYVRSHRDRTRSATALWWERAAAGRDGRRRPD